LAIGTQFYTLQANKTLRC